MRTRRSVGLALAATVLGATLLWGLLGQRLDVPTVFGDELIYWDAARSLASGDGLAVRGGSYGFGPTYPLLLAPVHALVAGSYDAYAVAKWVNALLFALAAVPVYLLARRLLTGPWALACAVLAVVAPSALYTGFVMTEGAAYAAAALAFLAIQLMLERPSSRRQLVALAAIALATSIRLQLAALGGALLLALGMRWLVARGWRLPTRGDLARLWPVLAATVVALAVVVIPAVIGGDPPGGYDDLWSGYAIDEVARWTWYAIGGLGLYFAFVPLVVGPTAVVLLVRSGGPASRSFAALVPSVTAVLLVVVGAFSATEFGVGFLHDRYLFYLAPLGLILVASWASSAEPAPRWTVALGAGLGLVLAVTLPTYLVGKDGGRQFDAVGTTAVAHLVDQLARPAAARWLLVLLAALAAVVLLLPSRARWVAVVPIAALFLANGALAWETRIDSARNVTFSSLEEADVAWVDRAAGPGATVAALYTGGDVDVRDAFRLTEFFNESVEDVVDTGQGYAPTITSTEVVVGDDGRVATSEGAPVSSLLVIAAPQVALDGSQVARGTLEDLTLWRAESPLTLAPAP